MDANDHDVEVIIIGGGPAGLSALYWCVELGMDATLFEKKTELGGQLLRTFRPVTNYLGIESVNGTELRDLFISQVLTRGGKIISDAEITKTDLRNKTIVLRDGRRYSGKAMILAAGVRRRRLGIPGEESFRERGVLESGVKAKDEVAGKKVLIVGGGDAAIENSLILSEKAERVIVVHRRGKFTARLEFMERAWQSDNIEFRPGAELVSILGSNRVEEVEIRDRVSQVSSRLAVDAVLIRIGTEPNTEMFRGQSSMDDSGYIISASDTSTNIPGIFAAGDITNTAAPTISAAVGQGAIAARSAAGHLSTHNGI